MRPNESNATKGTKVRRLEGGCPVLTVGEAYTICEISNENIKLRESKHTFSTEHFELVDDIIPEVPFGQLSDEHKIILATAAIKGEPLEFKTSSGGYWESKINTPSLRFRENIMYRLKPTKNPKELEIERIESEMRKLTDDLAKLKE